MPIGGVLDRQPASSTLSSVDARSNMRLDEAGGFDGAQWTNRMRVSGQ